MKFLHFLVYLFCVSMEISTNRVAIDDEEEGQEYEDEDDGGQAMRPNVDTFIMDHEQALQYLGGSVEVDAISISD